MMAGVILATFILFACQLWNQGIYRILDASFLNFVTLLVYAIYFIIIEILNLEIYSILNSISCPTMRRCKFIRDRLGDQEEFEINYIRFDFLYNFCKHKQI